jgi:FlaA1/EpsC-like NDP-sugar epimerase
MEKNLRLHILALPRFTKRLIVMLVDALLAIMSVWMAFYLRVGDFLPLFTQTSEHFPLTAVIGAVGLSIPIFMVMGLYRTVFRYSGGPALVAIGQACAFYSLVFITIFTVIVIDGVPRTVGIIQPMILFILIAASRMSARLWLGGLYHEHLKQNQVKRALIYGAGVAGRELAAALAHNVEIKIVGFLDDDKSLHGRKISGLPVLDPSKTLEQAGKLLVSEVMLALPSVGRQKRNEIINSLRKVNLGVRTLPSYSDLAQGRVTVNDIRDLSIDDILGRDIVTPDPELMSADITDKVVLVTGAGGSIGGELCKQIIKQKPSKLLLFEQSEFALYSILANLETAIKEYESDARCALVPILGSITNKDRLAKIFDKYRPNTIYHAAAYKHVPLVESNPFEGIQNNVFGTLTCAETAIAAGVKKFVLVSTDKAVRPTNVMGASKRIAEMVLQAFSMKQTTTTFAMVRFGNVLDSSGSVVPLFRDQIKSGGPVTVTHKDVTRYFMTISEAAQLVIQAGAMTENLSSRNNAPLYLLDMGSPIKIYDLAKRMIELSGLVLISDENSNGDIEINITGLRPGEKLFEELLIGEAAIDTPHSKIKVANEAFWNFDKLRWHLDQLETSVTSNDINLLRTVLSKLVSGYQRYSN